VIRAATSSADAALVGRAEAGAAHKINATSSARDAYRLSQAPFINQKSVQHNPRLRNDSGPANLAREGCRLQLGLQKLLWAETGTSGRGGRSGR
jgi:hypothetical protein